MSKPFPAVRPMTLIKTDNEVLLLKAARDVLHAEIDVHLSGHSPQAREHNVEFQASIHRLRRAVEIAEASETVATVPMEEK